jgi:hypothetical protein
MILQKPINWSRFFISALIFSWVFFGIPQIFNFPPGVKVARAAVPVVEGFQATSDVTESGSITLTAPTGITAGELLLIIVACDHFVDNTQQFTDNVSGWSMIGQSGDGDTEGAWIAAYWRKAAADDEGDVTVTTQASTNNQILGWYIRISGAHTTFPITVSNFTRSSGDSSSHVIPGVTTAVDDTLAI